jgi:rare lipoprotein A
MTAASKELPLPTYIKVKNLENGKEVIVKVNDRGPFVGDRILDLSYAAAKQLGFTGQGVTKVDIVALDPKLYKQYAENMKRSTVKNGSAKRAKSSSTKSSVKSSKTKKSKKNHKIAQVA